MLENHQTIFSNKGLNSNKLILKDNNGLITEEKRANIFFVNIAEGV